MEQKFKRGDIVKFVTGSPDIVVAEANDGNISGFYYNTATGLITFIRDHSEEFFVMKTKKHIQAY